MRKEISALDELFAHLARVQPMALGLAASFNLVDKVVRRCRRLLKGIPENHPETLQPFRTTAKWALLGVWLSVVFAFGVAVAPSGVTDTRVSQTSGTRPGTFFRAFCPSGPQGTRVTKASSSENAAVGKAADPGREFRAVPTVFKAL